MSGEFEASAQTEPTIPSDEDDALNVVLTEDPKESVSPRRSGIALCLSGGGYRAALFHLGALRRLNELGILRQVKTISSVSGGSILAAHLADRLVKSPQQVYEDWENAIAEPFRKFVSQNIRTWPILKRGLPWCWFDSATGVKALADRYEKSLTKLHLSELPDQPYFIFCATDMSYGVNWVFEKNRVGDFRAGYAKPAPAWPVARGVAASSCFPPIFNPLPIDLNPRELRRGNDRSTERDRRVARLRLTDGGVYDNMGLEPVWKNHQILFVSDGGAVFRPAGDRHFFWRLLRYSDLLGKQAESLRKRWLNAGFGNLTLQGAYWGLTSKVESNQAQHMESYSKELVEEIISCIRTDLDAFSRAEMAVLENHGYIVSHAIIERKLPSFYDRSKPPAIPHPVWMDETLVRNYLAKSHKRSLLGHWKSK